MRKTILKTFLIIGIVLIVASVVIPLLITGAMASKPEQSIIGGSDAPTFLYVYWQYSSMTFVGMILLIGAWIGLKKSIK